MIFESKRLLERIKNTASQSNP